MPLTIKHNFVSNKPDGSDATLIRPSNWNADHQITGSLTESDLTLADNTTGNASSVRHGFLPKLPNNANQFLTGSGTFATVTEAGITLADNTTNNVTTGRHGFVPKLPNSATVYLNGEGNFTTPAGSDWVNNEGDLSYTAGLVSVDNFQIDGRIANTIQVISTSNSPEFDLELGSNFEYTFNHQHISPTFVNLTPGQRITITFIQSAIYGNTQVTWPNNVKHAPKILTGKNNVTVLEFVSDENNLYAVTSGLRKSNEVFSDLHISILGSSGSPVDNDILYIDRGWVQGGGNLTFMNDVNLRLTCWNITAASATNPVELTLDGTTGIVNGQTIAISGATGSMASILNGIHTVTLVDATHVTIPVDGTGLTYSGSGRVGIGGSDNSVEIFIVANANTGDYSFQVGDLAHGLIFTHMMTGEMLIGRDLSLNGNGVLIARAIADATTATFVNIDYFAHAAKWSSRMVSSNTIDVIYDDEEVAFNAISLPPMSTESATVANTETFMVGSDDPTKDMYKIMVTGNITIDAVGLPTGKRFLICVQQDGAGAHTVNFASKFIGAMTVNSGGDTLSIQEFVVWDENNIAAISPGSLGMSIQGLPG